MMSKRFTKTSLGVLILPNNPMGAAQTPGADGVSAFWLAGNSEQYIDSQATFRTIAGQDGPCLTIPASEQVSGATMTLRDCMNCDPDFLRLMVKGYDVTYDEAGLAKAGLSAPGEDCTPCGNKGTEEDSGNTILHFLCEVDCNNNDERIVVDVFPNVPKFSQSAAKRRGAVAGQSGDLTTTPETPGADWLGGPCGWFLSFDEDDNPKALPAMYGCELTDEQCEAISALIGDDCACDLPFNGCPIDPSALDAGTAPAVPLLTC